MAVILNGINGGFNGKTGAVVGYYRFGKWVLRSLPKSSAKRKKGTPAQRASRSVFNIMQYFLSPILDYIRMGFAREAKTR